MTQAPSIVPTDRVPVDPRAISPSQYGIQTRDQWIASMATTWTLNYTNGIDTLFGSSFFANTTFQSRGLALLNPADHGIVQRSGPNATADPNTYNTFAQAAAWAFDNWDKLSADERRYFPPPFDTQSGEKLPDIPFVDPGTAVDVYDSETDRIIAETGRINANTAATGAQADLINAQARLAGVNAQAEAAKAAAAADMEAIRSRERIATADRQEGARQFNLTLGENQRQFDLTLGEERRQFNATMLSNLLQIGVELSRKPVDWVAHQFYMNNLGIPTSFLNLTTTASLLGAVPPSGPSAAGPVVGGPAALDGNAELAQATGTQPQLVSLAQAVAENPGNSAVPGAQQFTATTTAAKIEQQVPGGLAAADQQLQTSRQTELPTAVEQPEFVTAQLERAQVSPMSAEVPTDPNTGKAILPNEANGGLPPIPGQQPQAPPATPAQPTAPLPGTPPTEADAPGAQPFAPTQGATAYWGTTPLYPGTNIVTSDKDIPYASIANPENVQVQVPGGNMRSLNPGETVTAGTPVQVTVDATNTTFNPNGTPVGAAPPAGGIPTEGGTVATPPAAQPAPTPTQPIPGTPPTEAGAQPRGVPQPPAEPGTTYGESRSTLRPDLSGTDTFIWNGQEWIHRFYPGGMRVAPGPNFVPPPARIPRPADTGAPEIPPTPAPATGGGNVVSGTSRDPRNRRGRDRGVFTGTPAPTPEASGPQPAGAQNAAPAPAPAAAPATGGLPAIPTAPQPAPAAGGGAMAPVQGDDLLTTLAGQLGLPVDQLRQIVPPHLLAGGYSIETIANTPVVRALVEGRDRLSNFRTAGTDQGGGERFATLGAFGLPLGFRSGQDINAGLLLKSNPATRESLQGAIEATGQDIRDVYTQSLRASPQTSYAVGAFGRRRF